jgi:Sulfotransferase family
MRSKAPEIDIQPTDHVAFIHVPKAAGTTFNSIIEPLLAGLLCYPEFSLTGLVQSDLEDLRYFQFFRGHFLYSLFSDIIFPKGFIGLTFLRDPVERTISNSKFIHHLLKRDSLPELSQYADEFEQIKHLTLAGLLERTDLKINRDWVNFQTGFMGGSMDHPGILPAFLLKLFPGKEFELQARYRRLRSRVNDTSGINENREVTRTHLNIAKKRLKEIAFRGLVERFQDSLFLLSYTFGWRPILNAIRLNTTPEKDKWRPADTETLSRIRDIVKLDMELYQFGQDIFEIRFNNMTQTLLRRYGKKGHAALRWPLPADVMIQFLEQNYLGRRDRRAQQDGTPCRRVSVPAGDEGGGTIWVVSSRFFPGTRSHVLVRAGFAFRV